MPGLNFVDITKAMTGRTMPMVSKLLGVNKKLIRESSLWISGRQIMSIPILAAYKNLSEKDMTDLVLRNNLAIHTIPMSISTAGNLKITDVSSQNGSTPAIIALNHFNVKSSHMGQDLILKGS
ncbi:MAG: hypothetical protein WC568_11210 [Candidatus Methanoperedens sp.]